MANLHTTTKLHGGTSSAQLSSYLAGIAFPAEKEDLVSTAEHNGADDSILEKLDNLPAGDFSSMAEVMKAYGTEIEQNADADVYQTTPAETYAGNLDGKPLDLSNRQDRVWSGNPGSQEKLERNNTGTSPQTVRTSNPDAAPAEMEDDTNLGRFEDLSGAKTQGQGYELAGGKGSNNSSLSDEMDDDKADYLARRPM